MNGDDPTTGDPLTGKPELFATNLLLKRALEQGVERIVFRREGNRVIVRLHHPDREYEPETLSEQPDTWDRLTERLTGLIDEESGEFQPGFPPPESVRSIELVQASEEECSLLIHRDDS